MPFNFLENIFKVSETKDEDQLPLEWFCYFYIRNTESHCICNRVVYHDVYYFINKHTGKVINVGSGCCKKLGFHTTKNKSIEYLIKHIERGKYVDIECIKKYTEDVYNKLIEYLDQQITCTDNIDSLNKIRNIIMLLLLYHNDINLSKLLNTLINKISMNEFDNLKINEQKTRNSITFLEEIERNCTLFNIGKYKNILYTEWYNFYNLQLNERNKIVSDEASKFHKIVRLKSNYDKLFINEHVDRKEINDYEEYEFRILSQKFIKILKTCNCNVPLFATCKNKKKICCNCGYYEKVKSI